uniref:Ferredoxin n=1 Tax=Paulinella chromatophora TaxID=39717 RepID=B1X3U6_PAUCH|nr:Ferredoxin [Paulinella chromatophora]ACB42615.1 Ferredoxin [Paulinella chromatophora]
MRSSHAIIVHWSQQAYTFSHKVPEGEYILNSFEQHGALLPFNCRNGCCTTCAVQVLNGDIDHREAFGLSSQIRNRGYGLLCVACSMNPLELETQEEDEVYNSQFGIFFGRGKVIKGLPLDEG